MLKCVYYRTIKYNHPYKVVAEGEVIYFALYIVFNLLNILFNKLNYKLFILEIKAMALGMSPYNSDKKKTDDNDREMVVNKIIKGVFLEDYFVKYIFVVYKTLLFST